jgi:hypothetical protein
MEEQQIDLTFEKGQQFTGTYPPEAAIWCNNNQCKIAKDGYTFTIVDSFTPEETKQNEIASLKGQITSLESKQPRALRELALNPDDAVAKVRLQDIESEIEALRQQIDSL